jgi:hypothetical protein
MLKDRIKKHSVKKLDTGKDTKKDKPTKRKPRAESDELIAQVDIDAADMNLGLYDEIAETKKTKAPKPKSKKVAPK